MKDTIIESRTLRDVAVERLEVLDKVKKVLTIPGLEMITAIQLANYFEVDRKNISQIFHRHREEFQSDGILRLSSKDFKDRALSLHYEVSDSENTSRGKHIVSIGGMDLSLNGKCNIFYTKRAALRMAMLLRDSEIAKEIRTQLLNIMETAEEESPYILTETLDKEAELVSNISSAFQEGDIIKLLKSAAELNSFQKSRIAKLQSANHQLAGNILEWDNAAKINAAIRYISGHAGMNIGNVWTLFYRQLNYKYHINLKNRGKRKPPYLQNVKEDEWLLMQKTVLSIAESLDLDMEELMERSKICIAAEVSAREGQG